MSINSGPPSVLTSPPCWGRVLEDYQGTGAGGNGEVEELTRPWQAPSNWGGLSLHSHPTGTDQPTSLHGQLGPARLCSPSQGEKIRSGPQGHTERGGSFDMVISTNQALDQCRVHWCGRGWRHSCASSLMTDHQSSLTIGYSDSSTCHSASVTVCEAASFKKFSKPNPNLNPVNTHSSYYSVLWNFSPTMWL